MPKTQEILSRLNDIIGTLNYSYLSDRDIYRGNIASVAVNAASSLAFDIQSDGIEDFEETIERAAGLAAQQEANALRDEMAGLRLQLEHAGRKLEAAERRDTLKEFLDTLNAMGATLVISVPPKAPEIREKYKGKPLEPGEYREPKGVDKVLADAPKKAEAKPRPIYTHGPCSNNRCLWHGISGRSCQCGGTFSYPD